jgi:hypothetical protein
MSQATQLLKQLRSLIKGLDSESELQKLSNKLTSIQNYALAPKLWEFEQACRKREEEGNRREVERLEQVEAARKRERWGEVRAEIASDGVSVQRESMGEIPGTVRVTAEVFLRAEKLSASGGRVIGMANDHGSQPAWVSELAYEYPRGDDPSLWTPRPRAGNAFSVTSAKVYLYFSDHADEPTPPEGSGVTVFHEGAIQQWKVTKTSLVDADGTVVCKLQDWNENIRWHILCVSKLLPKKKQHRAKPASVD